MALRQGGACQQQAQPQRVGCRLSYRNLSARWRSAVQSLANHVVEGRGPHLERAKDTQVRCRKRRPSTTPTRRPRASRAPEAPNGAFDGDPRTLRSHDKKGYAHFLWATGVCTGRYGGRWSDAGQDLATAVPQLTSARAATQGDSVTATLRLRCVTDPTTSSPASISA